MFVGLFVFVVVDVFVVGCSVLFVWVLFGMVIFGGFYVGFCVISFVGMGGGDVKLVVVIGFVLGWYGWQVLFVGVVLVFVFGVFYVFLLFVLWKVDCLMWIVFGLWMIVGVVFGIVFG